jgi:hypothetical protein
MREHLFHTTSHISISSEHDCLGTVVAILRVVDSTIASSYVSSYMICRYSIRILMSETIETAD